MSLLRKLVNVKQKGDDDEIKSIVDNLNNILNTRRDYGFFLKNFGISDHHHLNSSDHIALMVIDEVTQNIKHFEPRVELIDIVTIEDDRLFRLSFRIDCMVRKNSHSLKLFLDPRNDHYQVDL